jgi:hypothetical protein
MVKFAISGKANSGKNTAAQFLGWKFIGRGKPEPAILDNFKIIAFADPMKEMVMKMYPETDPEVLWGPSHLRMTKVPNTDITYRQLLTDLGKLGRGYNPNVWVDATIAMANNYANKGIIPIIADCRFKNELFTLKEKGFFTIRTIRPNNPYQQHLMAQDISEIDLDDVADATFDAVIINDGSLEHLEQKISDMVKIHF